MERKERLAVTKAQERRVVCGDAARAAFLADLAARPHIEACGLLLGVSTDGGWLVEEIVPLRNTHDSASYFEFDPEELLQQDLQFGERIIGAYHSHPGGPTRPSRTDIDNMHAQADSPWIWLIVSPRGATPIGTSPDGAWSSAGVAAFRVEDSTLTEFPVEVASDADARRLPD